MTEAVCIDANLYGVEPEREEPPAGELGGCSCGAKFYSYEDLDEHQYECPIEPEHVATLVPGGPGSLDLPTMKALIFERDDGALNIHPPHPGPANCCDGRMAYVFVNRGGVTRCPSCDVKVGQA